MENSKSVPKNNSILDSPYTINPSILLRRFCFLGSLDAVFVYNTRTIDIAKYYKVIDELCKKLDHSDMLPIVKELINHCTLRRKDEVLFIYGIYLNSVLNDNSRITLRNAFKDIIKDSSDVLLFGKYQMLVMSFNKRKRLSKTIRKALKSWYMSRSAQELNEVWCCGRGEYNVTHRYLIRMSRVDDSKLGPNAVGPFFKSCTDIIEYSKNSTADNTQVEDNNIAKTNKRKSSSTTASDESKKLIMNEESSSKEPTPIKSSGSCSDVVSSAPKEIAVSSTKVVESALKENSATSSEVVESAAKEIPSSSSDILKSVPEDINASSNDVVTSTPKEIAASSTDDKASTVTDKVTSVDCETKIVVTGATPGTETINRQKRVDRSRIMNFPNNVLLISQLRTTADSKEALSIINKLNLPFKHIPKYLLRNMPIMLSVMDKMSLIELLDNWQFMAHNGYMNSVHFQKKITAILQNRTKLLEANIHPLNFMLKMHEMGLCVDLTKITEKKRKFYEGYNLYGVLLRTFGNHSCTDLRFQIVLNLQTNYKNKFIKHYRRLTFLEVSVAIAFAYFMREAKCDVFYWVEDKMSLEKVPFNKDMTYETALECCKNITNKRNCQRLIAPICTAMLNDESYDAFISIVPSAGRSNPFQRSDHLCSSLDKYREKLNPNAKFIIVNLLRYNRSMHYSTTRTENILEICGVDEYTIDIINNFALHHFN